MRALGRFLGRLVLVLILLGGALWWFGPYEPVELNARFDPRKFGEGVQVYFESVEARHDDITPGVEKRVIWRPGFEERRTPWSVLYLHGFSATSEEIRPVPDRVAEALGANLVFERLAGHGRGGTAMAEPAAHDWMLDVAEGLAAARAVGERVVVISTSTGGTLATAAAVDPELSRDVAAMVFISPNFGINDPAAFALTLPAARWWLPKVVGETYSFAPRNAAHGRFWTTSYPTVALLPMAALVERVVDLDVSGVTIPALFRLSDADKVVRPDITRAVAARWGGPVAIQAVEMGPQDDPNAHVIAGDIQSPGQTDATVRDILDWLERVGVK
ncbi:alpha/beta hydrolase [Jhaorihella thermophila]|uniref:Esterase/lipase n=1 Tax=Jhaorihella thermophila TaxID=488547 RepID=A0A1H5X886_9RHOB|nr:alpha/beta fold hydrolase [Jhaorihella thermophila]SEG07675.1 Esterase/lipase [Jhaorihella thermophila]